MIKKDFKVVAVIGFLIGLFALFPIKNIGEAKEFYLTIPLAVGIILGCAIFALIALFILKLLSKKVPVFEKFGKFAAVGTLNTVLDLSILNALTIFFGLYSGLAFFGFKAISFIFATTNSYFWNKFWTFQSKAPVTTKEYLRFGFFTLVGAFINASVALLVKNAIGGNLAEGLSVNVAAFVAVLASFIFNFLMYKNIVFKGSRQNPETKSKGF